MPDQDENKPYLDAIGNLRETTKWIIASAAGLAAFIVGSNPLSGLGELGFGWRWIVAAGSATLAILLTVGVLAFGVRVLSSSTAVELRGLVNVRYYRRHRTYLNDQVLVYFPHNIRTLPDLQTVYNDAREAAFQHPTPANRAAIEIYQRYVFVVLNIAKWLEVTYRFRALVAYFISAIVLVLICILAYVWAANPKKEKTPDKSTTNLALIWSAPVPPAPPPPKPPESWPVPPLSVQTSFDCGGANRPMNVGPFVVGEVALAPGATDVAAVAARLIAARGDRALTGLLLIGSADKTPLSPQLARRYETNVGLAQARAEWVRDQLQTQLQSGKSLADIAKAQGKSVTGLESALVSAFQSQLDQAVAAGKLTSAQRDQILSNYKARIDDFVNRTTTAPPPSAFKGGYRFAPGGFRSPLPAESPRAFLPTA